GAYAGQTFYSNSHALLIGIHPYANLPKENWLDFADKDATDLRDILVRSYGFLPENVTVLLNEQATKQAIEDALSALADEEKVKPDDRVMVFFSGHGQTVTLNDGTPRGFLIPYDAKVDLKRLNNPAPYLKTCLPMDSIWNYLEAVPARHRLLIADACFGGLLTRSKGINAEKPNRAVVANLLTRPALQVLTAGDSGQEVIEDPKLGHSAFTYKLLEELRAQAATADQVFLTSQLAGALKTSVGNQTNGKQSPQFGNHNNTEGDFVFVSTDPQPVPVLNIAAHPSVPPPTIVGAKLKKNAKDGAEMVFIPAGEFTMGSNDGAANERPAHKVMLDAYYIYRTPVTAAQYLKFCDETGHKKPDAPKFNPTWSKRDDPIVNVSYNDALAYCAWAGVKLPTEAQWEKAARGTDGRKYPWGDEFDRSKLWSSTRKEADAGGTKPVGSFPSGASPFGVLDMAGNVYQWCSDWYDEGFYGSQFATARNPENQSIGDKKKRVLRSASWGNLDPGDFRSAGRSSVEPDAWDISGGFRCVSGR
ncbi:MAG: hypothetical protein JWN14_3543, partial [Chthonomonadales bacterium]|nr:hypothetical protein [Chthonomonadales bacterium]